MVISHAGARSVWGSARMKPDDVKQAAVIFAAFAYNAAMRDAMIPRKTAP